MKQKVVIGMSGGVDSSVAAYLLKKQGYDVIGVTMRMWKKTELDDAKKVAESLGIPHYVLDFQKEFKEHVQKYFVEEYLKGRTPNPCIVCNRYVKWEALITWAQKQGAEYIATGHYARIRTLENGRYAVGKSITTAKDQTYALYRLTNEQLSKTLMPVGEFSKDEVRKIAAEIGLNVAEKPDSQEICFIPDHDYAGYITKLCGESLVVPGNFVDMDGKVLGQHKGLIHYTVGQRKGLNLSMGKPVFVVEIRPETNEVVIGDNEDCFGKVLYAEELNYLPAEKMPEQFRTKAKIRYAHPGADCVVEVVGKDRIKVTFDEPQRAITPGQAVVFYENDIVVGGGVITGNGRFESK